MKISNYLLILTIVLFPFLAKANIVFTEIMYNASGSGALEAQDYAELKNTSNNSIDISGYKFSDGSDHSINPFQSHQTVIPSGGVFVLVSNPEKFLTEWPQFNGIVLDSSVSFTTSDTALIKNELGSVLDTFSFNSDMGANNDGNSLQLVNGQWVASSPTPGQSDVSISQNKNQESEQISQVNSQNQQNNVSQYEYEQQIFANAGKDKSVLVGAEVIFNGSALGVKKEPLNSARFIWNFGDGSTKEGKNVSHTYYFPGTHVVTLEVSSGEFSQGDTAIVTALEAKIKIKEFTSGLDGYITIVNGSGFDSDISKFVLQSSTTTFVFPAGTIIKSNSEIRFPNSITKITNPNSVLLLYPNYTQVKSNTEKIVSKQNLTQNIINPPSNQKIVNNIKEDTKKDDASTENKNADLVSNVGESGEKVNLLWITSGVILIGITIAGVIYSRREKTEADLYEIEEIEE